MASKYLMQEFTDRAVTCKEDCGGNLFLLRWIFRPAPSASGLYRCCAKCGSVEPIIEGLIEEGSIV